jgi:antitoxin (DNA-binding transcriptional repressor) of toxin-antitoxin stability system
MSWANLKGPMSHNVPIEQAGAKLVELVGNLKPGDEIVLTEHDQPIARIVPSQSRRLPRKPGSCKGMLIIQHEDEEHLKDFGEYMP